MSETSSKRKHREDLDHEDPTDQQLIESEIDRRAQVLCSEIVGEAELDRKMLARLEDTLEALHAFACEDGPPKQVSAVYYDAVSSVLDRIGRIASNDFKPCSDYLKCGSETCLP